MIARTTSTGASGNRRLYDRWSIRRAHLAVAFLLLIGCHHNGVSAASSASDQVVGPLLDYFRDKGVLVPDASPDGRPQLARALTALFLSAADTSCGFGSPTKEALTGNIQVWQVRLPSDYIGFCAASPDPTGCKEIFRQCRAFDHAVFCDERFVLLTVALSNLTYNHMTTGGLALLSATDSAKPSPKSQTDLIRDMGVTSGLETRELVDILQYAISMDHADVPSDVVQPQMVHNPSYSLASDWIQDTLIGIIIGHEFTHVEQMACNQTLPVNGGDLLLAYNRFTCSQAHIITEMQADLRGLQLLRGLLNKMRAVADVPGNVREVEADTTQVTTFQFKGKTLTLDLRKNSRWMLENFDVALASTMIHFSEVELMLQLFEDRAPAVAAQEPCQGCLLVNDNTTLQHLEEYYRNAASDAQASLMVSPHHTHMVSPLRFEMFQRVIGGDSLDTYAKSRGVGSWAEVRFNALLAGSLDALQGQCHRTAADGEAASKAMFDAIDALKGSGE
jgi:hypothetical protein